MDHITHHNLSKPPMEIPPYSECELGRIRVLFLKQIRQSEPGERCWVAEIKIFFNSFDKVGDGKND